MTTTGWTRRLLVLSLGTVLITGCAAGLSVKNKTPGQRFDREMKVFAENCAKAKLKPNDTACDILKLKPADPLAMEEGRFAHSIKVPNPIPENNGYKPGMTPEQYFDHLSKTEAGEFIYKTVENVEGLYQMRLRESAKNDYLLEHLYAMEDPYGLAVGVRDLTFPQFRGHRVKQPPSSLHTRPGSHSRGSSAGASDYKTPQCIRRCPVSRLHGSRSADGTRARA
jgi:hypothetical protein